MRVNSIFVSIIIFLSLCTFSSCVNDFSLMPASEVEPHKVSIAIDFADDYLNTIKSGKAYIMSDLLIPEMKKELNETNQQNIYSSIKIKYGDYKSLEYAETWRKASHSENYIIRLKGTFSNSTKKIEIRVVINDNNKIAGFWIKPWMKRLA